MYCRKCGKQIDYDADFCHECARQELYESLNGTAEEKSDQTTLTASNEGSIKTGLGKAITSAILSVVSIIFVMIAYIAALGAIVAYEEGFYSATPTNVAVLTSVAVNFSLLTVAAAVIALIFGIKSINCFRTEKKAGRKKPIPTLIMGISSLAVVAYDVLFLFITLLLLALGPTVIY